MARRREDAPVSTSLDINDIVSEFDGVEVLANSKVLTTRGRVRSSIEVLNCLLGGGIPYGTVVGSFGPPSGGKSTESYEAAGEFLKQEPHGFVIILDIESSADPERLIALGVDPTRVMRVKPSSINNGFTKLIEILKLLQQKQEVTKTRIPVMVVWDTISKGRAEDTEEASRMDARNRARVIKSRLSDLIPYIEKMDIILRLLNQVVVTVDMYGNAHDTAGGGISLRHDEHIRLYIVKGKTTFNEFGLAVEDRSYITLDKTKICPKLKDIPIIFDITKGGKIAQRKSFLMFFYEKGLMTTAGGWFSFSSIFDKISSKPYYEYFKANYGGKFRYSDMESRLETDNILYILLRLSLMDYIGDQYSLQKEVMKPYYDKLMLELTSDYKVLIFKLDSSKPEVATTQSETPTEVPVNSTPAEVVTPVSTDTTSDVTLNVTSNEAQVTSEVTSNVIPDVTPTDIPSQENEVIEPKLEDTEQQSTSEVITDEVRQNINN